MDTLPAWLQFLLKRKSTVIYVVLVVVATTLFWSRFSTRRHSSTDADYRLAEQSLNEGSPEQLAAVLDRHGELQGRYDGPCVQAFLREDQPQAASKQASPLLRRASRRGGPEGLFSATTLLISRGELEEAAKHCKELEAKGLLESYNQLRLALLHRELGNQAEELAAWERLLRHPSLPELARKSGLPIGEYAQRRLAQLGI